MAQAIVRVGSVRRRPSPILSVFAEAQAVLGTRRLVDECASVLGYLATLFLVLWALAVVLP